MKKFSIGRPWFPYGMIRAILVGRGIYLVTKKDEARIIWGDSTTQVSKKFTKWNVKHLLF